jgi:hypothetical protein
MSGQILQMYIHPIPSHPITNDQGQTPNMAQPVNVLCSADFQDLTENPMGMAQQWGTTGSSTGWSFGASNRIIVIEPSISWGKSF